MPTAQEIRDNQKKAWGASAAGCERSAAWYRQNFAAVFDWLCSAAGATPGAQLLDVACGAGQPALSAAARVGPLGKVVGIDLAPEMLAVAARQAQVAQLENVEFQEMGAEDLSFADGVFDGVTCSFALMFCPDAVRAVAEMRRVVKPGRRVAVVVWDEVGKNAYLRTTFQSVAQFFPPAPPPNPRAPGAFRFAPASELEAVLSAGGLADVSARSLHLELEFASVEEHWQVTLDQAGGLKTRLSTLSETEQARLREVVREALRPFVIEGRVRIGATVLCGSGVA